MLLQTTDSGSNNTGDLFVVTAATATLSMTGEKGSLRVDGLRPHTIWFADKPSRTGGQLDTNEFFGQEFLQNGLPNSLHCTAAALIYGLYGILYIPCMKSCGISFTSLSCLLMRLRPWASCFGFPRQM